MGSGVEVGVGLRVEWGLAWGGRWGGGDGWQTSINGCCPLDHLGTQKNDRND